MKTRWLSGLGILIRSNPVMEGIRGGVGKLNGFSGMRGKAGIPVRMPRNIRRIGLRVLRDGRAVLRRGRNAPRFAAELVRHPRTVGAICPSGAQLAASMAACIPDGEGLVIEIGAGTGAVTRAILARGVAPSRLLVLERSPEFCRILRGKFPELNVVQGDAALLSSYVSETDAVLAVVSSLPLMNFPSALRGAKLEQIQKVIGGRGCVIQFTYALLGESPYARTGFRRDILRFIPRNLPPARVERFWLPSACRHSAA